MNNRIKIIASIMIFVLIAVLIAIFIGYYMSRDAYRDRSPIKPPHVSGEIKKPGAKKSSGDKRKTSKDSGENNKSDIHDKDISGNSYENEYFSGDYSIKVLDNEVDNVYLNNYYSGEDNNENNYAISGEHVVDEIITIPEKTETKESVISSNVETSNEEKRQVLNELDTALQSLLEAVGRVPTVDEEKLDASLKNSGVNAP